MMRLELDEETDKVTVTIRVLLDTDSARYPANNFAGYRISGFIVNIEFILKKKLLIRSSHHLFNSLTGYPVQP